jgi:hypothetical protein
LQEDAPTATTTANQIASHISTTAASFRDFLLKPEILRAINDCAFEVSLFIHRFFVDGTEELMRFVFAAPVQRYFAN